MANPSYGTTYDKTLPTVGVHWVGKPAAVTNSYVVVASNSTRSVGIGTTSSKQYKIRIAYQWRKRHTPPASDWDGETTWTDWQNDAGTVGGWTQLWSGSTGATPTSYQTIKGVRERTTPLTTFSFDYDISEYDAIQYRFRSWFIVVSGSTVRYGDYVQWNRYVVYNPPLGTVTGVIDPSNDTLAITFAPTYPRGYEGIQISTIKNAAGKVFTIDKLTGNGADGDPNTYIVPAKTARKIYNAGMSFTVNAHMVHDYPAANYGDWVRNVTATIKQRSETMAQPVMAFNDTDDMTEIRVNNDDYEALTITATWADQEATITPELLGDVWLATFEAPFGEPVTYTAGAYLYAGDIVAEFSDYQATHTAPFSGKSMFTSQAGKVWLAISTSESRDVSNDVEEVTLADGTTVARHGNANERTRSLQGEILAARHSDETQWLDAIRLLETPTDWTYRNPLGERVTVAIDSVRRAQGNIYDVLTVAIDMHEVD